MVWRSQVLVPLRGLPHVLEDLTMDYRPRGRWIGNVRGRLGKAGYGGSDVACILVCISSVMRVCGPTAIYDSHSMHTFIDRGIVTYCIHLQR